MNYSSDISDIVIKLQDAINNSNAEDAANFAEALARTGVHVNIRDVTGLESELIKLNINVKKNLEIKLEWNELKQVTVRALKLKLRQTYQIEPAIQKWIINGRFACETDKLVDFIDETNEAGSTLECYVHITPDILSSTP